MDGGYEFYFWLNVPAVMWNEKLEHFTKRRNNPGLLMNSYTKKDNLSQAINMISVDNQN
jgi:hypothetical protein